MKFLHILIISMFIVSQHTKIQSTFQVLHVDKHDKSLNIQVHLYHNPM